MPAKRCRRSTRDGRPEEGPDYGRRGPHRPDGARGAKDDYELSGIDLRVPEGYEDFTIADMTDIEAIRPAFEGKDAVIDFANNPAGNLSWEDAYTNNIHATFNSMRAAQEAGVGRYIYTSSNRITEEYQQDEPYASICRGDYNGLDPASIPLINTSMPVRPNGPYGIGKAAAEAAGRYFVDKHGLSVICLRLGTMGRDDAGPRDQRQFATMLTPRDVSSSTLAPSPRRTISHGACSTVSRTTSGGSGTSATRNGSSATSRSTTWRPGAGRSSTSSASGGKVRASSSRRNSKAWRFHSKARSR